MEKTAILGSGMAGFGAAYRLHQEGIPSVVYDKNSYHGGHTASFGHEGGYKMMADLCARANRTDSLLLVLTLVALATGSFLCMASSASATAQDFVPLTTFNGVACASPNQCIGVGTAASGVKSGAAGPD